MIKQSNKGKVEKVFIFAGSILIVASLFFMYRIHAKIDAGKAAAVNLEENFEKEIDKISVGKEGTLQTQSIPDTNDKTNADMDELTIALENLAVGIIRIDKLDVVLPIFEDTSNQSLLEGVGILEDTDPLTSKENTITVLAGHRGGRNDIQTFLNINKLEKDDVIKITTKEDILYYKVVGEEIIDPTDWTKFTREEGKTKLFLMTCHPYPHDYQRLLVKAELVKMNTDL